VFEGKKRDPAGAIGVVGIGRLGGQVADSHQLDTQDKIFFLTELLATVNLLLFFFNLLPLLPLDGGHVAGRSSKRPSAGAHGCGRAPRSARTAASSRRSDNPLRRYRADAADHVRRRVGAGSDHAARRVRRHRQTGEHRRMIGRSLHGAHRAGGYW